MCYMNFGFSKQRWDDTKRNYETWWQKKSDKPMVIGSYQDYVKYSDHKGASNLIYQSALYDDSVSIEYILEGCEYTLLCNKYFGDSYPVIWTVFSGPGAIASYMGGTPVNNNGAIWFMPPKDRCTDISKIDLTLDENNKHYEKMKGFLEAAVNRFSNNALVAMPDIGGNLDILSAFLKAEELLIGLYDDPDDVKRLTWQAHEAWHKCFGNFNNILTTPQLGYSNWSMLLSQKAFYMLQCDFAYMIGPDTFNEFVRPELEESAKKINRTIYHLDGTGQLRHLESILEIKELSGVQWVPGESLAPVCEWPDVIKKVIEADKLFYYSGDIDGVEKIHQTIGHLDRMYVYLTDQITDDNVNDILRRLDKMGISF